VDKNQKKLAIWLTEQKIEDKPSFIFNVTTNKIRMKTITRYIDAIKGEIEYQVGGNAKENHQILKDATMSSWWFHIQGQPSAHVIAVIPADLEIDKKQLKKILVQGAVITKQVSRFASHKEVPIIYCRVDDVTPTEYTGEVIVTSSRIMLI
jgi:predicted ribosome quality control (RQC) complex YloA/Tae2 family protein